MGKENGHVTNENILLLAPTRGKPSCRMINKNHAYNTNYKSGAIKGAYQNTIDTKNSYTTVHLKHISRLCPQ